MLTILRMELVLNELDEYVVPSSLSRTRRRSYRRLRADAAPKCSTLFRE
jgi:hypothetical protein